MSKLGQDIIEYLKEHAKYKLPDYGVIGGQSVAEAYFRIKNIPIYTRIKDIDLFMNFNNKRYKKKYSDYTRNYYNTFYKSTPTVKNNLTSTTSSFAEELIEKIKTTNIPFKIKDVFEIENINIIEVEYWNELKTNHIDFLKATIESFDINSIEIGVCLKTKRVFKSEAFKEFENHKQVCITNYNFPIKSICRFLEKRQYYKGAYFNADYEINLVLPHFVLNSYKTNKSLKGIKVLRDSFNKLNNESKQILNHYFKITNESFENFNVYKFKYNAYYEKKKYDVINKHIRFNNLNVDIIEPKINYFNSCNTPRIMNDKFLKEDMADIIQYKSKKTDNKTTAKMRFFKGAIEDKYYKDKFAIITSKEVDIVKFEPRLRRFNKVVRKSLKTITRYKQRLFDFKEFFKQRDFLILLYNNKKMNLLQKKYDNAVNNKSEYLNFIKVLHEYKIELHNLFNLQDNLTSVILRHIELTKKMIIYFELKKEEFNLKDYSKKLLEIEKSNHIYIIGYIESGELPLSFLYKSKEYVEDFVQRKSLDKKKSIEQIPDNQLKLDGYKINHINNTFYLKRVGKEMRHCVGGYESMLLKRQMLFFDIYDKKNERYTLSVKTYLKDDVDITLKLDQCKMNSNRSPSKSIMEDVRYFIENAEDMLNKNLELKLKLFGEYIA